MQSVLNVVYAFAVVAGLLVLWWLGIRLFWWLILSLSSLVPFIGRKHRHERWDQVNEIPRTAATGAPESSRTANRE